MRHLTIQMHPKRDPAHPLKRRCHTEQVSDKALDNSVLLDQPQQPEQNRPRYMSQRVLTERWKTPRLADSRRWTQTRPRSSSDRQLSSCRPRRRCSQVALCNIVNTSSFSSASRVRVDKKGASPTSFRNRRENRRSSARVLVCQRVLECPRRAVRWPTDGMGRPRGFGLSSKRSLAARQGARTQSVPPWHAPHPLAPSTGEGRRKSLRRRVRELGALHERRERSSISFPSWPCEDRATLSLRGATASAGGGRRMVANRRVGAARTGSSHIVVYFRNWTREFWKLEAFLGQLG